MSRKKKRVAILGSTGTIGQNTLRVVRRFPERFQVVALTAFNNLKLLARQAAEFDPDYVAVSKDRYQSLTGKIENKKTKLLLAPDDLEHIASLKSVDIVVIGMGGSVALKPFLSAVRAGKTIAPANKEALVVAGHLIMKEAQKYQSLIVPVDSEQSAIFQALQGNDRQELKKVYLTASGGALLNVPSKIFDRLTVQDILNHPRWKMGKKITVDSATLLNKGFEVIEAMRLFQLQTDEIQVLIHPEAIIHSMVEYLDGSIIAQLGITDMRLPIQYALTYPERWETGLKACDFFKLGQLNFQKPDLKKFPCLALALDVSKNMGTYPSVMNAADEIIVDAFLKGIIPFKKIYTILSRVLRKHQCIACPDLEEVIAADRWAREETKSFIY
ncbi:MAG: 1-deoxy-D-xylulose-5-phosphate reductoisomerase [Candidatus Omnitrophica bacterium]|nr:1-deoxy-D-xylulose-5-phosphate reductoisomerase [Candidatus Omnitrophota bacterium]